MLQPVGSLRKGRPHLRWIDGLEKYLLVLRTRYWRTLARRRLAWKRLLEKAKAHPGCRAPEEGRNMLCEGDTKNRWRDGQVCPDVRQGTMASWARRLRCVLACYVQIGRGRGEKKKVGREGQKKSRERTDGRRRREQTGERGEREETEKERERVGVRRLE
ncbi:hypothetical protein TNCV_4824201 [Trichonephila clavipes]|nr:hypothetical protein TNCV_4824201 [Trichonephila clavipes]